MNFKLGEKFKIRCIVVLLTAISVILFNPFYSTPGYTLAFKAHSEINSVKTIKVFLNSGNDRVNIDNYVLCFSSQVALTKKPRDYNLYIPYKAFKKSNFIRIEFLSSAHSSAIEVTNTSIKGMNNKIEISNSLYKDEQDKSSFSYSLVNDVPLKLMPSLFLKVSIEKLLIVLVFSYIFIQFFLQLCIKLYQRNGKFNFIKIFFVLSICIVVLIPLVKLDYKKTVDNLENRKLAEFPGLFKEKGFNISIGSDIDKYFSDRFGKRKNFLKLKESIFSINKVSSSSSADGKIYGYQDNWFFVNDFLNLNFDKKLLDIEKTNLEILQKHYNCPVYVLVYPFKSNIYKEAPSSIYNDLSFIKNESDKIANYLNDSTHKIYTIDLTPIYKESQKSFPDKFLFYKDDHHQTEYGAYLAVKSIFINKLPQNFTDPAFVFKKGVMGLYAEKPFFTRGVSYIRTKIRSLKEILHVIDEYPYLTGTAGYENKVKQKLIDYRVIKFYENSSPIVDGTALVIGNSFVANTGRMTAFFAKKTIQYPFMAGRYVQYPLFDIDKFIDSKVDYVIVTYFTNTVMSKLEP